MQMTTFKKMSLILYESTTIQHFSKKVVKDPISTHYMVLKLIYLVVSKI